MKKLNLLLLKKRPYLFILLCFSVFLMNLFLWNETSQLIRNIPVLKTLQSKSSSDIYELMYVPNATDSGEIKEFTPTEIEEISQFFKESFFEDKPNLYLSKEKYISNTFKVFNQVSYEKDNTPIVEYGTFFIQNYWYGINTKMIC